MPEVQHLFLSLTGIMLHLPAYILCCRHPLVLWDHLGCDTLAIVMASYTHSLVDCRLFYFYFLALKVESAGDIWFCSSVQRVRWPIGNLLFSTAERESVVLLCRDHGDKISSIQPTTLQTVLLHETTVPFSFPLGYIWFICILPGAGDTTCLQEISLRRCGWGFGYFA